MGFTSFLSLSLSLPIYSNLFQFIIRVLNINKTNKLYLWDSQISISLSFNLFHILINLKIILLLVQNRSDFHPTHATLRCRKARQRCADHEDDDCLCLPSGSRSKGVVFISDGCKERVVMPFGIGSLRELGGNHRGFGLG